MARAGVSRKEGAMVAGKGLGDPKVKFIYFLHFFFLLGTLSDSDIQHSGIS